MTEFLLLGACWLLLSLPVSVLLGRCIAVGQAGETERHAAAVTPQTSPEPVAVPGTSAAVLPTQRQATADARMVS